MTSVAVEDAVAAAVSAEFGLRGTMRRLDLPEPAGFLCPVIEAVHDAGGLYIADEVQPGFARTGDSMWGFQRDRGTGEPDGATAVGIVNDMRERRVLISATGPLGNMLKIRPPLPFGPGQVDQFMAAFTGSLADLAHQS